MTLLLEGRIVADEILKPVAEHIASVGDRPPCLAFLQVGSNMASKMYVEMKQKRCAQIGIMTVGQVLEDNASEGQILAFISSWNANDQIDGILVQLPLPSHISTSRVLSAVDPDKDVDGFHPLNMGRLAAEDHEGFIPCTPLGIHLLLRYYGISPARKKVVILGRSTTVGKSLALLWMQKRSACNATVTVAHSGTQNLALLTRQADILVAAMGQPELITGDMLGDGVVIVDVGTNKSLATGKLVGDIHVESAKAKARALSPVPGGVGPMTIACLLRNTVRSWTRSRGHSMPSFLTFD